VISRELAVKEINGLTVIHFIQSSKFKVSDFNL